MLRRHTRFMDISIAAAQTQRDHKVKQRVGAVIVQGNRVIRMGYNSYKKTHPRAKTHFGHFLHAEVHCVLGLRSEALYNSTIYVGRINKLGQRGISKPCPHCQLVLQKAGIRDCYYLNKDGIIERMVF